MKKTLLPIAVASALSIAALGTLPGLAQEDAAQLPGNTEKEEVVEKKEEEKDAKPGTAGGEKFVDTLQPPLNSSYLEVLTEEATKKFAAKAFPATVADRVVKIISRGKELDALFSNKVKELDTAAAKPDLSDVQVRRIASEVTDLKGYARRLNQAVIQFLAQSDTEGFPAPSMANRIAGVADLNAAIEAAEVQLGLRPAPAAPRTGTSGRFNRGGGGPRQGGDGSFNWPGAPTRADLLAATMSGDDVKAHLEARFPAPAMERIGKLVMRARELAKSLDEKVAKIDVELADEKLSDEQIEAMVILARGYRSTKENLTREFDNISMSNLSMQTMSEAVSWLPQLSRAVKQAESNIEAIDREALSAKAGIRASEFAEMYREAKALHSRYDDSLPAVQASLQNQNLSPQQRGAIEAELKVLQASIQRLAQAIGEYDAMQASKEPIPSERFVQAAKLMREALAATKKLLPVPDVAASQADDPKEAHAKLYQLGKARLKQVDDKLKAIGVQIADPNIARDQLDALSQQANDLRSSSQVLREVISGYENSIQDRPNPDQAMVVDNVVGMQRAIRNVEASLGIESRSSSPNEATVHRTGESGGGSTVRIETGSDRPPLVVRLTAACETLKEQLETRLKEIDAKLSVPEVTLEQIDGLAKFRHDIENALKDCTKLEEILRSQLQSSSYYSQAADRLRRYSDELVRIELGPSGLIYKPAMVAGAPPGMGGSGPMVPMRGMPGMMGGPTGMMPGMAQPSPFQEVDKLRALYKKHFDEKNEKAAAEVKDKIAKELARVFDAQQAAREKQLATAREKLKKLEDQQARRKEARDELIDSRTKEIIHELEGTEWTDDVPVEELAR